jgi:protein-arginine kinase activator protein McsA
MDIQKTEKRCDICKKEPTKKVTQQAGMVVEVYDVEKCPLCNKEDVCADCRTAPLEQVDRGIVICAPCYDAFKNAVRNEYFESLNLGSAVQEVLRLYNRQPIGE